MIGRIPENQGHGTHSYNYETEPESSNHRSGKQANYRRVLLENHTSMILLHIFSYVNRLTKFEIEIEIAPAYSLGSSPKGDTFGIWGSFSITIHYSTVEFALLIVNCGLFRWSGSFAGGADGITVSTLAEEFGAALVVGCCIFLDAGVFVFFFFSIYYSKDCNGPTGHTHSFDGLLI